MPISPWSTLRDHFTGRAVLIALITGFGLVMLLLGAAGLVSVREGRNIRSSAEELVREQILITRLLHEAQVEEDALALALHRLARTVDITERKIPLDALDQADRTIARLATEASSTPQAIPWQNLTEATRNFTRQVRTSLDQDTPGPLNRDRLDELFSRHDAVVRIIHDLILDSTEHLAQVDQKIGLQLQDFSRESALLLSACFILALLCAAGTIAYVRHSIHRIESQADELNHVSWHMLQSQEETARRFSHELHDELGQSLAAVRANISRKSVSDPEALRADNLHLVDEAIANVRELSQLLRPVILDDFGLDAGLRWLTEKFAQRTRIAVHYESSFEQRLHSELETHLFRIAQEALTNIARHSEATEVFITLTAQDNHLSFCIKDNGRGLPSQPVPTRQSLGLIGMRARARECGGVLTLDSGNQKGLTLTVIVPIRLEQPDLDPLA
jgi:signal transduction histidine kinase